jgi:hypothetical protein
MSRSSKHPNKKPKKILGFIPKRLWPVVVLVIGAFAITGVVLLISQESALPEGYMPQVSGAPALEVEQPFFELGEMHFNVPANVTYVLRNVGDKPLRILDVPQVQVLEGC